MAIMCYLADKAGSDLWPKDARQNDVIRWLSWDAMHFSRHGGTLFFPRVVKPQFGLGDPDLAAIDEAMGFFREFAGVLNSHLEGRRYLVGDGLTVADFAVACFCRARRLTDCRSTSCPRFRAGTPRSSSCPHGATRSRPRR
jgi:glutathione S-transferase